MRDVVDVLCGRPARLAKAAAKGRDSHESAQTGWAVSFSQLGADADEQPRVEPLAVRLPRRRISALSSYPLTCAPRQGLLSRPPAPVLAYPNACRIQGDTLHSYVVTAVCDNGVMVCCIESATTCQALKPGGALFNSPYKERLRLVVNVDLGCFGHTSAFRDVMRVNGTLSMAGRPETKLWTAISDFVGTPRPEASLEDDDAEEAYDPEDDGAEPPAPAHALGSQEASARVEEALDETARVLELCVKARFVSPRACSP